MYYAGNSMAPTLKTGDALRVVQYEDNGVRIGDVAAFRSPKDGTLVVHRVVSVGPQGVKTKGDNNLAIDDWVLQPNDIIGRVVSVRRHDKKITFFGGFFGQVYCLALEVAKRIDLAFSHTFGPVYRWLGKSDIFRRLFSRWIGMRVFYFKRGDGMELQLRFGRRVVGRLLPGQDQWYIRRPFKLFVDEAFLPSNNPDELTSMQHPFLNPSKTESRFIVSKPVRD
jgi:signal peptidase I